MVENCPFCGQELAENQMFCPKCGRQRVAKEAPAIEPSEQEPFALDDATVEETAEGDELSESPVQPTRRSPLHNATVIIAGLALLLALVGLALGAIYLGLKDREASVTDSADVHYERGIEHFEAREYELAIAELEYVLAINADYPGASEILLEAQQHLNAFPSPTPVLGEAMNEAYFALVIEAYEAENWSEVISTTDQLWSVDSTYQRTKVDEMLFDAYYYSGLDLIDEGRIEEAIRMYNRALAIDASDDEARLQLELATEYMNAMSYWGADWESTVEEFEALYEIAPSYLDVRARLFDALVNYGDFMGDQDAWCSAEQAYSRALQIGSADGLAEKAAEAEEYCLTLPPVDSDSSAIVPKGTFTATYEVRDGGSAGWILIRGQVLDSSGKGVANVVVRIQAWNWTVTHTTDGLGQFSFDGLDTEATYTVSLDSLDSAPIDVPTQFGKITWVVFSSVE